MSLNHRDIKNIQVLAKEGKRISEIHSENYPEENYQDIKDAVHTVVKITSHDDRIRIGKIMQKLWDSATDKDKLLLDELDPLIIRLYKTLRSNRKKLDELRKILS